MKLANFLIVVLMISTIGVETMPITKGSGGGGVAAKPPSWYTGAGQGGTSSVKGKQRGSGGGGISGTAGKKADPYATFDPGYMEAMQTGAARPDNPIASGWLENRYLPGGPAYAGAGPGYRSSKTAALAGPRVTPTTPMINSPIRQSVLPSYYNASNPQVSRMGNSYTTQNVPGFGQDQRQNVPRVIPPNLYPEFFPTSMPIIERAMGENPYYLPQWMDQGGGGGPNWWGGYGRGGGGGGYSSGYNSFLPSWYTGLFNLNANRSGR